MREGRTLVPTGSIEWGNFDVQGNIQVYFLVARRGQFTSARRELPMLLLSQDVKMFCSVVLVHGEQELVSPPRACNHWQSLTSFKLSFSVNPDGDIRVRLEEEDNGFVERFLFEEGARFFRSPEFAK